jgi:hypothetical protein
MTEKNTLFLAFSFCPVCFIGGQTDPENIEQIRERLRKMSDREPREYGRATAHMADPKNNYGNPNPAFKIQLDEARAEWRRRHSKLPSR